MDFIPAFPLPFYLIFAAVLWLLLRGYQVRNEGWGIPLMAVTATAGSWYLMDPIYNDYTQYIREVGEQNLTNAFWEVLIFIITLGVLSPGINRKINSDLADRGSQLLRMIKNREIEQSYFQEQIARLSSVLLAVWVVFMSIALVRVNFDFVGLFLPYLSAYSISHPWDRGRVGGGIDALFAFAGYFQIMLTALLGVVFAVALRPSTMLQSGLGYFLAAPFYLLDRTRSNMLVILMPGLMAFVGLRVRSGLFMRIIVLVCAALAIEGWMKFVIENRESGNIIRAVKEGGIKDKATKSSKHEGFNMFEELGFINYYIDNGTYHVNWGQRYFSEIVNPIPRALWPRKPLIGIDYAIARGMAYGNQDASSGGVAASVSTGMIGQGVVNFGRILGPIAAALLMAIWIAVLARLDLMGNDLGHLLLYAIGLILTYNMGRDITLLVLYPFVFGWLLLWWYNRKKVEG